MTDAVAKSARQARVAVWALAGMAVVLAAVAAGLLYAGWQAAEDGRLLAREGVAIDAEVVDRRIREERRRQQSGNYITDIHHLVTIRYAPPGGAVERQEREVGSARYEAMPVGTKVTITYAPSKPAVFEFEAGDLAADAWWFRVVAGVMLALAAGSGWGARALGRHARALRVASERRQA